MTSSKSHINIANKYDRIIVLVDMDCFYCQVEEKLNPNLVGKPIAVVQYNTWQGGGIIAVNYPARAQGVTRHMRGNQAKEECPEIELVSVPNVREKADLTKYREAGKEVANVLQTFTPLLERASVDEAYLDITEQVSKRLNAMNDGTYKISPGELINTFAVGYENIGNFINEISSKFGKEYEIEDEIDDFEYDDTDLPAIRSSNLRLLIGASIVSEIRSQVKEKTGYECSAGIAHNKILAKLACGINKPNKQTILPLKQISGLFRTLPVGKIKGLGGKFGEDVCEILKIKFLGDLLQYQENELQQKFDEKSGSWLYLIAHGIDLEAVTPRFYSKSIGCCKKFPGRNAITGLKTLNHWLNELAVEISDRLQKDIIENNRKAKQMVLSYIQDINSEEVSSSRSTILTSYNPEDISKNAFDVLKRNTEQLFKINSDSVLNNPIKFLGISVGKFETIQVHQNTLQQMFIKQKEQQKKIVEQTINTIIEDQTKSDDKNTNVKKSFFHKHFKKIQNSNEIVNVEDSNINEDSSNFHEGTSKDINSNIDKSQEEEQIETENINTKKIVELNVTKLQEQNQNINTKSSGIKSFFLNAKKQNKSETKDYDVQIPSTSKRNSTEMSKEESLDEFISDVRNIQTQLNEEIIDNTALTDYTKTYVEYARPQPKPEDYIKCTQCNQKILSFEIQTHLDSHLAFQLSQQQREEYRKEIKQQFSQTPPNKKLKSNNTIINNNSGKKKQSLGNIDKFLKKHDKKVEPNDDEIKCPECNCIVEKNKFGEHEDLHLAQKLQREWNQNTASSSVSISTLFAPKA